MARVWELVVYGFKKIFEENSDPRTKDMFLASSPYPLIVIMTSYLAFCTYIGPRIMQNRKPFQLKNTLIVYNAFQVALSIFLVVSGYFAGWRDEYSIICQPIDYTDRALRMNNACWWYYFAKITELLDTVFFVLRKKNNQVTFLHVYHHTIMPIFGYIGVRHYPNGHGTLFGIMNSFVHVIMYSYYLIAGLGPQYQKYLWWKKHVTTIQLIQFALIFLHNFPPLFTNCTYPKGLHILLCLESSIFLYMFGKFYIRSYRQSQKSDLNGNENVIGKYESKTNGHTNGVRNGIVNGKAKIS